LNKKGIREVKIAIINITGGRISGGYRKYLSNIIPRIAVHPDVESLLCASPPNINVQSFVGMLPNVKFINCVPYRLFRRSQDQELKNHLKEFSPDVIFVPVERNFRFKNVPVVNMIQNMEPFVSSIDINPIIERLRVLIKHVDGKRNIKKADRIIALSNFVSDFLETQWKISADKIGIVYHGIEGERNSHGHKPDIIPNSWSNKFIFTAGSIRPARGLKDLFLAMMHLSLQDKESIRLVIAGGLGSSSMAGYMKKLKNWIRINNLQNRICWTGILNEKEMTWCYHNCRAFVMTSRVEACPNIALEAMSHGCICIAANNPPLPEFFGDSAIFYSPLDGQSLAGAIKIVHAWDTNQRRKASEQAKKRASKFSWDICADRTLRELAQVA